MYSEIKIEMQIIMAINIIDHFLIHTPPKLLFAASSSHEPRPEHSLTKDPFSKSVYGKMRLRRMLTSFAPSGYLGARHHSHPLAFRLRFEHTRLTRCFKSSKNFVSCGCILRSTSKQNASHFSHPPLLRSRFARPLNFQIS